MYFQVEVDFKINFVKHFQFKPILATYMLYNT